MPAWLSFWHGKNGVVLTDVCTSFLPCHVLLRIARNKRGGLNIVLYKRFPLSCLPTVRKVKPAVLIYVCTWLSLCRVFLLIAR